MQVENASIVFPRGMAIAAMLVTTAYGAPVVFGTALAPDITAWTDGYFVTLASNIAPWLGVLTVLSAALANLSTLLTSLAAYTRTFQAVVRTGVVPVRLLGRNLTQWRTPVPAIALFTLSTAALMAQLDFSTLVVVDSAFYILGQASVIIAFVRLRIAEPELERPYRVPGGMPVAYAAASVTLTLAAIALYITAAGELVSALAVGGALVAFFVLSIVWERVAVVREYVTAVLDRLAEDDARDGCIEAGLDSSELREEGGLSGDGGELSDGGGKLGNGGAAHRPLLPVELVTVFQVRGKFERDVGEEAAPHGGN